MSKSKGNVVYPDDMVKKYGADALRLFMLFSSPPEKEFIWNDEAIDGCFRFLNRVWVIVQENMDLFGSDSPVADEKNEDHEGTEGDDRHARSGWKNKECQRQEEHQPESENAGLSRDFHPFSESHAESSLGPDSIPGATRKEVKLPLRWTGPGADIELICDKKAGKAQINDPSGEMQGARSLFPL